MAQSWPEMGGQTRLTKFDPVSFMSQLLRSESAEREVRSIAYQMSAARFPAHRDLQGLDFAESKVDESLVKQLHSLSFLEAAHNLCVYRRSGHWQDTSGQFAVETLRTHQRGNHYQPRLCGTAVGIWRRENDHRATRPAQRVKPQVTHKKTSKERRSRKQTKDLSTDAV